MYGVACQTTTSMRWPVANQRPEFFLYAQGLFRPWIVPNYQYQLITHKCAIDHNKITYIIDQWLIISDHSEISLRGYEFVFLRSAHIPWNNNGWLVLWGHHSSNECHIIMFLATHRNAIWEQQHLGQVTKLRLSCYLVLLSVDSKTR